MFLTLEKARAQFFIALFTYDVFEKQFLTINRFFRQLKNMPEIERHFSIDENILPSTSTKYQENQLLKQQRQVNFKLSNKILTKIF